MNFFSPPKRFCFLGSCMLISAWWNYYFQGSHYSSPILWRTLPKNASDLTSHCLCLTLCLDHPFQTRHLSKVFKVELRLVCTVSHGYSCCIPQANLPHEGSFSIFLHSLSNRGAGSLGPSVPTFHSGVKTSVSLQLGISS